MNSIIHKLLKHRNEYFNILLSKPCIFNFLCWRILLHVIFFQLKKIRHKLRHKKYFRLKIIFKTKKNYCSMYLALPVYTIPAPFEQLYLPQRTNVTPTKKNTSCIKTMIQVEFSNVDNLMFYSSKINLKK